LSESTNPRTDSTSSRWIERAKPLGSLLAVASLGFVGWRIWHHQQAIDWQSLGLSTVAAIAAGALSYGLACGFLSIAWWRLLRWCGAPTASLRNAHKGYARTQLAKYLPGNVFHFAGRHAMGRAHGIGHATLVGAAVHEVAGMLLASASLALLGFSLSHLSQQGSLLAPLVGITVATLLFPWLGSFVGRRLPALQAFGLKDRSPGQFLFGLGPVFCLYAAFFAVAGAIVVVMSELIAGLPDATAVGTALTSFAIAWIVGYVAPGAPSGIGIREAILTALLASFMPEQHALIVALSMRLVTSLGDVVFFLTSLGFRDRSRGKTARHRAEHPQAPER
jgi:uncharacterized membrane protein YbhN (UPF0104 family)